MSFLARASFAALRSRSALCTSFSSKALVATSAKALAPAAGTNIAPADGHGAHFKLERYWAAAMLPLLPASYFIHGPVMDVALSVALVLHIHWGATGVIQDYARPFVIGETLAKAARASAYLITILLTVALFHFNYNDVGLTRAFEMVFSL
uniref:Succinate dehydrogenase [ubiquinone] cytochrome b small subunit n=1 Tax=Steinernema glaseri TaxID=37863 RepID=A0A1I8A5K0_9BILA